MSNLLDSASIVLTPTAYDNGKMLSVKPSVALGPELVTNGDFATDSDWIKASGSTISGGSLNIVAAPYNANTRQSLSLTNGTTYEIVINAIAVGSATDNTFQLGFADSAGNPSNTTQHEFAVGTSVKKLIVTASATDSAIIFRSRDAGTSNLSITNVSVKEVLVADGDFDFSRNSAATRVNAQGLVENVQILSGDLVSNGDFSQEGAEEVSNGSFSQEGSEQVTNGDFATDSDWSKSGWVIESGQASNSASGVGNNLYQGNVTAVGKTFKVVIDTTISAGSVVVMLGGGSGGYNVIGEPTTSGTFTYYGVSNGTDNRILLQTGSGTTIGSVSIDNVSVKEVGQDWALGTGWSIGEDKAVANTTGNFVNLYQNLTFVVGKTYKTTFTISDYTQGSVRLTENGYDISGFQNAVGTYTTYFTASQTALYMQGYESFIGSITNISVKEVGQNWVLDANWSIAEDKAVSDGANGFIRTSTNVFESGKTYKVGITVSNMTTGQVTYPYDGAGYTNITTNGDFSQIYYADDTNRCWIYGRNGFDGSITNISILEITDDTNLPRINYEGFSYQDVLGSEEVVNGDFATDSDWSKTLGWSISSGTANCDGSQTGNTYLTSQSENAVIGKTYIISFTTLNITSGWVRARVGGINTSDLISTNGQYTYTVNATASTDICRVQGSVDFIGSIDNVSVKEYLGQEVVPDSGCGSWLLEPQSTNLIAYSEDFSSGSWVKTNSSVVSGFASPSGILNAFKLINNATASVNKFIRTIPSATSGIDYSLSVFAKKGEYDKLRIEDGNNSQGAWFDLSNGTLGTVGGSVVAKIEDYGNGWYRCSITKPSITTGIFFVILGSNIENIQVGDGTSGVYIWGAQSEQQSYSTSYIPTNGAASTRLQDIANNSGNATLINSTEGVLYAEIAALANNNESRSIQIKSSSDPSTFVLIKYGAPTNRVECQYRTSGYSVQAALFKDLTDSTESIKIAFKWQLNNFALYINGVKISEDLNGNVSPSNTFNNLLFDNFYGKTKALVVYKEALTDEQLTCLTTI